MPTLATTTGTTARAGSRSGPSTAAGEAFAGTFEGNGHVIANLYIDRERNYVGLFGATATTAEVRNVGLTAVDVTGDHYAAGLVGWSKGRIATSYASGSVTTDDSTTGGLVGWNDGTVVASYADASVAGGIHAGGLVGGNGTTGVIDASYASGSVSGSSTLGGLVGFNSGQLRRSYARGGVTASSTASANVGGLSGRNLNIVADQLLGHADERAGGQFGRRRQDDQRAAHADRLHGDLRRLGRGRGWERCLGLRHDRAVPGAEGRLRRRRRGDVGGVRGPARRREPPAGVRRGRRHHAPGGREHGRRRGDRHAGQRYG